MGLPQVDSQVFLSLRHEYSKAQNNQTYTMTDYEEYPKFVVYDHQPYPLLGEGNFEFNQDIDKTRHESYEALKVAWKKEYFRCKAVLATANGNSDPDAKTQDLINDTVEDFGQWGFEFARYGYFLGWKNTTDYLDLAKGFAGLKKNVYTDPCGNRGLLKQHLENLGTLKKAHFPDGDPKLKKEEKDTRGRKPVVHRTASG